MSARILLLACLLFGALAPAAGAAPRSVPRGWLGVVADGPLVGPGAASFEGEWDRMAADGVESVRTAFYWNEAQPYERASDVPPQAGGSYRDQGGVPTDFSRSDVVVASAARRRLGVLPVVHRAPGWAAEKAGDLASTPRGTAAYAAFLTALVRRYGSRGTFWSEHPELPRMDIRAWQVWNEPNLTRYWSRQPFARSYVKLLRAADRAIHAADPTAQTVLAGLPNESYRALRQIYGAGGKGTFDVVAIHPYTGRPRNVVRLVELARAEMRRAGDGKRALWVTELSWPAAKGRTRNTAGFETTDAGQADRLRSGLALLAAARVRLRIGRVFWYTWLSVPQGPNSFDYSGLRRLQRSRTVDAPAREAFRREARRLEGCPKPTDARRCR
jgi:hypothetical protein